MICWRNTESKIPGRTSKIFEKRDHWKSLNFSVRIHKWDLTELDIRCWINQVWITRVECRFQDVEKTQHTHEATSLISVLVGSGIYYKKTNDFHRNRRTVRQFFDRATASQSNISLNQQPTTTINSLFLVKCRNAKTPSKIEL